jgi:hypothetical protein
MAIPGWQVDLEPHLDDIAESQSPTPNCDVGQPAEPSRSNLANNHPDPALGPAETATGTKSHRP